MNEEIILQMKEFFNKLPKPKDKLYLDMMDEMQKKILRDLETKNPRDVLAYIRDNWFNNSMMTGPVYMNKAAIQMYPKLLFLTKNAEKKNEKK